MMYGELSSTKNQNGNRINPTDDKWGRSLLYLIAASSFMAVCMVDGFVHLAAKVIGWF